MNKKNAAYNTVTASNSYSVLESNQSGKSITTDIINDILDIICSRGLSTRFLWVPAQKRCGRKIVDNLA